MEYRRFEGVEVEVIWLAEELELEVLLGWDDRLRAAPKAAVVDPSDGLVMVGEFWLDFRVRNERKFCSLGGGGEAVEGVAFMVF